MARPSLTNLELAIMGLLDLEPMSGYDVQRVFATTPLAHFSSSPGAIYPTLKRLEQRGLVTATLDRTTETRPRRVYSLTEEGLAQLREWLQQPVTRDELVRNGNAPVLRFVLCERHLAPAEVIAYLEGYAAVVRGYLMELEGHRIALQEHGSLHQRLALLNGIRGYEAHLGWIEEAVREVVAHAAPSHVAKDGHSQ